MMELDNVACWSPWELAVKYVECHRGWNWGKAAKALNDACASGELTSKWQQRYPEPTDGPDAPGWEQVVWQPDLWRWLNAPKLETGKQPLVMKYLAEMFPNQRVPDPPFCQRKGLLAKLRCRDPLLASLDHKTMDQAIGKHNLMVDGNRA